MKIKRFFKRFGVDIAGYACLILVLPIGVLPGPGGIPLLITGLSLLSIHNSWAKGLLDYAKENTSSLRHFFFPKNKILETLWDIAAAVLFIAAFVVPLNTETRIIQLAASALVSASIAIFLSNRSRIDRLGKRFKKSK